MGAIQDIGRPLTLEFADPDAWGAAKEATQAKKKATKAEKKAAIQKRKTQGLDQAPEAGTETVPRQPQPGLFSDVGYEDRFETMGTDEYGRWKRRDAALGPLPDGWEEGMTPDGKLFFVDHNPERLKPPHNNAILTYEDPRMAQFAVLPGDDTTGADYRLQQDPYRQTTREEAMARIAAQGRSVADAMVTEGFKGTRPRALLPNGELQRFDTDANSGAHMVGIPRKKGELPGGWEAPTHRLRQPCPGLNSNPPPSLEKRQELYSPGGNDIIYVNVKLDETSWEDPTCRGPMPLGWEEKVPVCSILYRAGPSPGLLTRWENESYPMPVDAGR